MKNAVMRQHNIEGVNGVDLERRLEEFTTKELVEELRCREGVRITEVPPYTETIVKTVGPSIIIEVID